MTAIHSSKWWYARLDTETKYASGSGSTAHAQTKLSSLASVSHPRSHGKKMFPSATPQRIKIESNDDGAYGGEDVDGPSKISEGSREEFIQDSFYFDKIISQLSSGQGSLPVSYALHWQDHLRAGSVADNMRYESFGCYLTELVLNIPQQSENSDGFPYWAITDKCYSTKYDDSDGTDVDSIAKQAYLAISSYPVSTQASIVIDGSDVESTDAELTITMKYDEDIEAGDDAVKYPYFLGVDISFRISFKDYASYKAFVTNILLAQTSETLYTIKINTGLASCFPQITNMEVTEGDFEQVESPGMAKYEITFNQTYESVLTKETS
jgi:hypothetical protein